MIKSFPPVPQISTEHTLRLLLTLLLKILTSIQQAEAELILAPAKFNYKASEDGLKIRNFHNFPY